MLGIFITLLTFILIIVTLFMCLVVLMQRPNTNAGMGAAFGGGVTESTFGADTTNVLTRATKWSGITFFALAIVLYALYLIDSRPAEAETLSLPDFGTEEAAPAENALGLPPAPETTAVPTPVAPVEEPAASAQEAVEATDLNPPALPTEQN